MKHVFASVFMDMIDKLSAYDEMFDGDGTYMNRLKSVGTS